jgi:hypothetical protein
MKRCIATVNENPELWWYRESATSFFPQLQLLMAYHGRMWWAAII